jgi:hypothetical protein
VPVVVVFSEQRRPVTVVFALNATTTEPLIWFPLNAMG